MTQQVEEKLKQIQEKLLLLSKQHAAVKKENGSLKEALSEARKAALEAASDAEALQHQLDARKYTLAKMEPEERKAFEKKISGYIREIDKCIALLSV